jgi:endoglucanase
MREESEMRDRFCAMRIFMLFLFCPVPLYPAEATAKQQGILWGVNESGLEFGKGPSAGTNFSVPNTNYYLSRGVQLIRVPFQIIRLQPIPNEPLAPNMVGYIKGIIAQNRAAGAVTVLDPHGYGFYPIDGKPQDILKNASAQMDYLDMMQRIARTFGHDGVAISLMNEPHTGTDSEYAPLWNKAIAVIRGAGFSGVIIVPHSHWSTASDITPDKPFSGHIVDPENNWVLELHLYLDPDNSGTYKQQVVSPGIGVERLSGAIAWSRRSKIRLFLGETGAPPTPAGLAAFQEVLLNVAAAPDVFWGVAIWGGGAWWKPNYSMRLDPVDGVDRPQFMIFENMITPELLYFVRDGGASTPYVRIQLDGNDVGPPVAITALRSGVPQIVPIRSQLNAGKHEIRIVPTGPSDGGAVYIVDSTWKGASDSDQSYGIVPGGGFKLEIVVPN